MNRRDFLGQGAGAFLTLPCIDPFFSRFSGMSIVPGAKERILVVLELAGGNDGLNTVIPYEDPLYHRARKVLRIRSGQHVLEQGLALHPDMGKLRDLYKEGGLAICNGVGYPNPDRSHFRSMDIWQSGRPDLQKPETGWLGLAAEVLAHRGAETPAMALASVEPPLCLAARRLVVPALSSLRSYELHVDGRVGAANRARKRALSRVAQEKKGDDRIARLLKATARQAYEGAEKLKRAALAYQPKAVFPNSALGRSFELAARALSAPLGTRIIHLRQGGFDTHAGQLRTHGALLGDVSDAIWAFSREMRALKVWDRCLVLCFSEFGRRVKENASRGTDHGAAGPVFLAGGALEAGLHGKQPSLSELDRGGDLRFSMDFRSIYKTVLESWLDVPAKGILADDIKAAALLS